MRDLSRCTFRWVNEYGDRLRCMLDVHSISIRHQHGIQMGPIQKEEMTINER